MPFCYFLEALFKHGVRKTACLLMRLVDFGHGGCVTLKDGWDEWQRRDDVYMNARRRNKILRVRSSP